MSDGIFTQPGPDGIFGRGGDPADASSPPIDGDDTPLRETLVVDFPSPGHMRVARAIRHPKTGKFTEFQEEFREPTPSEVALLKQKGVVVGPGSMVVSQNGVGEVGAPAPGQPWFKIGAALAIGAAGCYAVTKYVLPMFGGEKPDDNDDAGEFDEDTQDS